MSARRQIIAALSEDSLGGIATLQDVDHAVQLVDAHATEVLAEAVTPAEAATIYADRLCICDETPCPTWCPASVPTDARITEIRQGVGGPLTARELSWLKGAAGRHELHVIGSRGGHWPLTDDLPGALLLVSQYLAAAMAVIERADLVEEKATAPAAASTPDARQAARDEAADWFASYPFNAETTDWARGRGDNLAWVISILRNPDPRMPEAGEVQAEFFQVGHTYTEPDGTTDWKFRVDYITTHPEDGERTAIGWRHFRGEWDVYAYGEDDFEIHRLVGYIDATEAGDGS